MNVPPPLTRDLSLFGGGNIGSQFVDHVARFPGLRQVRVVDRDAYELGNAMTQAIRASRDVGRWKAVVQASRLARLNPALNVRSFVGDLGAFPPGLLRGTLVAGCLDSVGSRARLGEMAWRMGAWFIDAGVHGEAGLVRVSGYRPDAEGACFHCALHDEDYRALGASHPCGNAASAPPSQSTFSLGGVAAALLAVESCKILAGETAEAMAGRELLVDVRTRKLYVTVLRRNPRCRFDHRSWPLQPLPLLSVDQTLEDTLDAVRPFVGAGEAVAFSVALQRLACALSCPGCGSTVRRLHVVGRRAAGRCTQCRRWPLQVSGQHLLERVDRSMPKPMLRLALGRVGIEAGDVLVVEGRRGTRYLELQQGLEDAAVGRPNSRHRDSPEPSQSFGSASRVGPGLHRVRAEEIRAQPTDSA